MEDKGCEVTIYRLLHFPPCEPAVFVVEMWKWLSLPPPEVPEGTNRHYQNEEFEIIMKRYFEEMRERQKKIKARVEQAKKDAENNDAGPAQEDAQQTEIEFTPTKVEANIIDPIPEGDETSGSP